MTRAGDPADQGHAAKALAEQTRQRMEAAKAAAAATEAARQTQQARR